MKLSLTALGEAVVRSDNGAARRFARSTSSRMPRHRVKGEALVRSDNGAARRFGRSTSSARHGIGSR
ncbi:MAG: hypothetical protein WBH50_11685, partial [Fuerstiella sp.]